MIVVAADGIVWSVTCAARSAWAVCRLRASNAVNSEIPNEPPILRERLSRLDALVRNFGASVVKARVCMVMTISPSPSPWTIPLRTTGRGPISMAKPVIR